MDELTDLPNVFEMPFRFGEIVYLRIRDKKVAGEVNGFLVDNTGTLARVQWSDDLSEKFHYPWQLTKTYQLLCPE